MAKNPCVSVRPYKFATLGFGYFLPTWSTGAPTQLAILKVSKVRTQDKLGMWGICHDAVPVTSKWSLRDGRVIREQQLPCMWRSQYLLLCSTCARSVEVHWCHNLGNYGEKVPLFSQRIAIGKSERDRKKAGKRKVEGKEGEREWGAGSSPTRRFNAPIAVYPKIGGRQQELPWQ